MNEREEKRPRRQPDRIGTVVPTTGPEATAKDESFLVKLSKSCRKHQMTHEGKPKTFLCRQEEEIPKNCRKNLTTLGKILPKVEKTYRATPADLHQKGPATEDVRHMCDFFSSVLNGLFCPHAPHIFRLGKGGIEIFPRVHYLFQHLVSKAIIANTVAFGAREVTGQQGPVSEVISSTIAHLLSSIPEPTLQESTLLDLIYMAVDLSALAQSGILESVSDASVDVLLFDESVSQSELPGGTEYLVPVQNMETLLSLQAAVFSILHTLMKIQKTNRLSESHPDPTKADLSFHGILDDSVTIRSLLGAIRQVLLVDQPSERRSQVLMTRARESAAYVLADLQEDYGRDGAPTSAILCETGVLVAKASLEHFRASSGRSTKNLRRNLGYSKALACLVSNTILDPPRVQGSMTPLEVGSTVLRASLPTLLESLRFFSVETMHALDEEFRLIPDERGLEWKVLEAIESALSNSHRVSLLNSPSSPTFSQHAVASIFWLLSDRSLSDSAFHIATSILQPETASKSQLAHVERICASFSEINDNLDTDESASSLAERNDMSPPSSGSKRGRSSHSVNGRDRSQLNIDTNPIRRPKRSRADSAFGPHAAAPGSIGVELQALPSASYFVWGELGRFLFRGFQSAKSMMESFQLADLITILNRSQLDLPSATMLRSLVANARAVSLATKLLLSVINASSVSPATVWDQFPALSDFLGSYLEALNILSQSLDSAGSVRISERSLFQCLVESTVSCGLGIQNTLGTDPKKSVRGLEKIIESFLYKTKNLYSRIKGAATLTAEQLLKQTIANMYEANKLPTRRIEMDTTLSCFVSTGLSFSSSFAIEKILCPVSTDHESQKLRLDLLRQLTRIQVDWDGAGRSLQQTTFDSMRKFELDCSDPLVRLLQWQSIAWLIVAIESQELRRCMTSGWSDDENTTSSIAEWLTKTAFADSDDMVRELASADLGRVFTANGYSGILATLAQPEEWKVLFECRHSEPSSVRDAVVHVGAGLFQIVDKLLHEHCRVPQSQLSFTVGHTAGEKYDGSEVASDSVLSFQRSAVRSLVSMCQSVDMKTPFGKIIFEYSMIRVVRLWTGMESSRRAETSSLCFGELSVLPSHPKFGTLLKQNCMDTFAPALFRDVLVPSSGFLLKTSDSGIEGCSVEVLERQYRLLKAFIERQLSRASVEDQSSAISSMEPDIADVLRFVEWCLPFVIAQLVVEKDYDALRLTAGFKLFLLAQKKAEDKQSTRMSSHGLRNDTLADIPVESSVSSHDKGSKAPVWTRDLEMHIRDLCLAPGLVESVLPLLLMKAGRSELIFLKKDVLQDKMTLKSIITSREQLILKSLVWELGRNSDMVASATRAIRTAAIARNQDPSSMTPSCSDDAKLLSSRDRKDSSGASEWITSNFMYLLVNVVQYKWSSRAIEEKVHALRCLVSMLDFLLPAESGQYIPQIMATINAAIAQRISKTDCPQIQCLRMELRLFAVRVLSKFIKLVAQQSWQALGANLTSMIVSLVPLLSDEDEGLIGDGEEEKLFKAASAAAVDILEWLSQGALGKKLAPYFTSIPFLPPSPALDSVRASLRELGVDFDNLHVITTQGTQQDSSIQRDSVQSDGGSVSLDSKGSSNVRRQAALRKRLEMVCSLLGNENSSIRRVVLNHLIALLRANRELFHALVENEGATSMKRYVTIAYPGVPGFSRGTVTEMVEVLLTRCVNENDPEARILLATCFGEVGAIGGHRLEDTRIPAASNGECGGDAWSWRLSQPPWQSSPVRYELQLVTKDLVVALKAAPTSHDQHKIAFTIQQLLVLLDKTGKESGGSSHKGEMTGWLSSKLSEAGVLDVVEPFWSSEFHEAEGFTAKQPPYFQKSTDYYTWLSHWCRYMVQRSNDAKQSQWSGLFYACRTALRTRAGLSIAEFLLPILVLDRICFGNGHDEQVILQEMREALTFDELTDTSSESRMNHTERQKAVSALFMVIDTLQVWSEKETELRHQKQRGASAATVGRRRSRTDASGNDWPLDESIMRIDDILEAIPLALRARAAASVGMHARALRLLEMASRATVSDQVFNGNNDFLANCDHTRSRAAGMCPATNVNLMKDILAALSDYETMNSLGDDDLAANPKSRARDSIRQKEACGDWEGASQDYERALQLGSLAEQDPFLQRGALRCLLELGQFQNVLNQVNGIIRSEASSENLTGHNAAYSMPVAAEAAWRLGKWEKLSELVRTPRALNTDADGCYRLSLGHAMLGLHEKQLPVVASELRKARDAVMQSLSSAARESYSRAYDHIIRLHALREVEDAADVLCCSANTESLAEFAGDSGGGCWESRLELLSSRGANKVMNVRLALARLAGDAALEGSLFLNMGKRARKAGFYNIASNSFAQAEAAFGSIGVGNRAGMARSSLQMQLAKLKHDIGESSVALRMLGQENLEGMVDLDESEVRARAVRHVSQILRTERHGMREDKLVDVFVRSALQSTRWMVEGGLKGGAEIMSRFRIIHVVAPKWEKGHFQFAKYLDSVLRSRLVALQRRSSEHLRGGDEDQLRNRMIALDRPCQSYVLRSIKHYAESLSLDTKHVYQALPRLLSLWFDFTSISLTDDDLRHLRPTEQNSVIGALNQSQEEANTYMAKHFKNIPAQAFYTAMPQLVSRVVHDSKDTASVVQGILKRVLAKYPAQAMWPLAWLRQSKASDRQKIGDKIFQEAVRVLAKSPNQASHKILVSSKSLFKYFQDLAKFTVKDGLSKVKLKSWRGEVDLVEFVPPIQAALSITLAPADSDRSRDLFPRQVPRMRTFADAVSVMGSKARPKKLKAFVIPADSALRTRNYRGSEDGKRNEDIDIGEIHFLVKQEAKGDLRKDARVQDLNNVINRLMASSEESKGSSRSSRRLTLRTFAVTCLSEDTGILEWVPHTQSLRSLVSAAYNPQASPFSSKRRGRRLANFAEPALRNDFEKKCQSMYFENGNLKRAATMFEQVCLKSYPPLLYWWFVQNYQDPHAWYEARTRFTLSAAAWSAVGHVIGLGDRHSENILVDTTSGECVHVDFDCIFDKGLNLPKPEVVPFRLTANMLDAFGPTGSDGVYSGSLQAAMGTLRNNRDTLLSVLEPFIKDPVIDWKRYRSQQKSGKAPSTQERQTKEAKRSINVVDERLQGVYNLRNPNHKKIRRTDGIVDQQDDELSHLLPLSVEGQTAKMIAEATSSENLVQLYVGWMPWV